MSGVPVPVYVGMALAVAVSAAVRSTWSPCGLSMLSTITPLAERSRGHRFGAAAAWYVAGAVAGGLALGAVGAGAAWVVAVVLPAGRWSLVVAGVAACVALGSDLRIGGVTLPVHHRQVNERWLDRYRVGVYAGGFGFQIGTGLATYIMTAGVYLTVVLGVVSGSPWLALGLGVAFGSVRGLMVLVGRRITTTEALLAFHARWLAAAPAAALAALGSMALVVAVGLGVLSPWAGVAWVVVAAAAAVPAGRRLRHIGVCSLAAPRAPDPASTGADRPTAVR